MDRERCLKILRNMGVGKKTVRLILRLRTFRTRRGVAQGRPLSPTIFNLMVGAVVQDWERRLVAGGTGLENIRELFP